MSLDSIAIKAAFASDGVKNKSVASNRVLSHQCSMLILFVGDTQLLVAVAEQQNCGFFASPCLRYPFEVRLEF